MFNQLNNLLGISSFTLLALLAGLMIILAVIVNFMRDTVFGLGKAQESCPNCGSSKIGVVSKEPQGVRDVSGGFSSRHDVRGTIIKVRYLIKKRCNECRHGWQETVEES